MSDYTRTPNKLRIVKDEGMPDTDEPGGQPMVWQLDAVDTRDVVGFREVFRKVGDPPRTPIYNYTEQVWNYATHAEAVAAIPEFIEHLATDFHIDFPVRSAS